MRNEEVLQREKEDRNILQVITRRKAKRIVYILRRSCLLKHVIEGKAEGRKEVTGRRGRRRRKLLEYLKDVRGYRKLKEEALGLTCGEVALEGCMALSQLRSYTFQALSQDTTTE